MTATAPPDLHAEALRLAHELVRVNTSNPPGREAAAAAVAEAYLRERGVATQLQDLGDGRANLVARVPGGDAPALVFCGHLDTVTAEPADWTSDPWSPELRDGRLYGRGTVDMKGSVAVMTAVVAAVAASDIAPPGDVVLALVAGEEVDSAGASALAQTDALDGAGAIVVGEPTGMTIGIAHRGALWLEVVHDGRAAHGSQPQLGDNAVVKGLRWLGDPSSLESLVAAPPDPLLGSASISLNGFGGGGTTNIVPDRCRTVLDLRTIPGQDHDAIVRRLEDRKPAGTVRRLRDGIALSTPPDAAIVRCCQAVLRDHGVEPVVRGLPYLTDASVLCRLTDAEIVVFGPGDERLPHQADEYVETGALEFAGRVYFDLAVGGPRP
jgi:succinyl-diaminopimelate desuccinylase